MSKDLEAFNWLNNNQLSYDIWNNKYRHNNEDFKSWLDRVSNHDIEVAQLIKDKKFIFGGRILANRGLNKEGRKITYSNCYVIAPPEDNIESIFETGAKLARTYSYGGGCGIDVSKLRPKNAKVNNAADTTSGTTSFMDFFSYVTGLIGQSGRRGALMISIDCTHPDLEEFINLKSNLDLCTKANISVKVNHDFMNAVVNDQPWQLSFKTEHETINKTVSAREIFKLLAKRNWEMAEPGILFWDTINDYNMLNTNPEFKYAGTNPCAEEPLPAGGSCLLGSLNLSEFVKEPFTNNAHIDFENLEYATSLAVVSLNQILMEGMKLHPLKEQQESVDKWRQIGLGTMGLGDMLIKLGIKYDTPQAMEIIDSVFHTISNIAVETSLEMAKKLTCFPGCNSEEAKKWLSESSFINSIGLPKDIIKEIAKYGLYNSQLLTCAPTGSIGTMFQTSTGVEPNFAFEFNRRTVSLNKEETTYKVYAKIVEDYQKATNQDITKLPDYFVASGDINPMMRVEIQSVLQRYIDASISSTINLKESATVDDVYNIYLHAWEYGLKGVTVYRDNCQRQGILTTSETQTTTVDKQLDSIEPISRSKLGNTLTGTTTKYKTACGTLYITINKDEDGNIVEIFTNSSKNGTCKANLNGETRLASLALRAGVKVNEVIDSLRSIQCQSCAFARAKNKNAVDGSSCPDIISKCLMKAYNTAETVGISAKSDDDDTRTSTSKDDTVTSNSESNICPECGEILVNSGGCNLCANCGWSKCG